MQDIPYGGFYLKKKTGPVITRHPSPVYRIFALKVSFIKRIPNNNVHNLLPACLVHIWCQTCLPFCGNDGNMHVP
nr:MAG TPA: hypothetical protein [Caudoviricetes sp.]DAZ29320.1 MAG TPA: hypothetical protein [Caudoviricetes sp.]